jgi:hypothetical protein
VREEEAVVVRGGKRREDCEKTPAAAQHCDASGRDKKKLV